MFGVVIEETSIHMKMAPQFCISCSVVKICIEGNIYQSERLAASSDQISYGFKD